MTQARTKSNSEQDKSDSEVKSPSSDSLTAEAETTTAPADDGSQTSVKKSPAKKKKKKKKKKVDDPYKEYHDFAHQISKMPYHKTLAINRGEKNGRLKVKIQYDENEVLKRANKALIPHDHAFKEFLQSCVKDAMSRLVVPSLEREIRRETTEAAEKHAVQVFARNLKNLLLQSPVRDHRVLAIDPGYKRGCSVAVLDKSGQLLDNAHIFVVGNEARRVESKGKLLELINQHSVSLIAIGNGAACREAEQMVSDLISESFADKKLQYAIVNEAGASFYSTSEVGREEFPDLSPAFRSAVSIGRRLIDPLSELVKISPANIGVGLYQHDVKAKHLAESLDDVVQFCVNRVGVNVNSASTSLLKYVSGLNQLTARRVYEFRKENGRFKNREQLKEVAGFGDATFVQSAGFLRIRSGDQPLDTTAIHPEFYEIANKVIERVKGSYEELFPIAIATKTVAEEANQTPEAPNDTAPVVENVAAATKPNADNNQSADSTDNIKQPESHTATAVSTSDTEEKIADVKNENAVEETERISDHSPKVDANAVAENNEAIAVEAKPTTPKPEPIPVLTEDQINRRRELVKAIRELDADSLSKELGAGRLLVRDIVQSLCKPEYDPRNNINRPVFRSGIIKLDDLKKDMCLDAQVVNVVDFGVFVDIGLGASCLVHVSQLANHFIRDPYRFYAVGDSLRVWVTDVDSAQRRVKLTAVQPQSLRPKRKERKSEKPYQKSKFKKPARSEQKRFSKPRRKPKPVKPITTDMLKGDEPMRSFSDLAQFFDKKPGDEGKKSKN